MTTGATERKRARSPSYPGIDLQAALERAGTLRQREGRNFAPVDTIVRHWGYSPGSGRANITLAALKKFGLLVDQGSGKSRQARLSDLALRIVLDERPDSEERRKAIQEAALNPAIHAALWQEFGGSLPSDDNLRYRLRVERGFTDSAADEFIGQFRRTVAFAELTSSEALAGRGGDKPNEEERPPGGGPARPPNAQTYLLPIAPGEYAMIEAAFPLSREKWNQMVAVLKAMKPALVSNGEAGVTGEDEEDELGDIGEG